MMNDDNNKFFVYYSAQNDVIVLMSQKLPSGYFNNLILLGEL